MKLPKRRLVEVCRRVLQEAVDDSITGEAAKMAYYFFLSLFPMILALFAFTGLLGEQETFEWIMDRLRTALPGEASGYMEAFVREITSESRPGMLSFGLLLSLWAASNAFAWLMKGLNVMYDIEDNRAWWKQRGIALAALVVTLFVLTLSSVALLAGPSLFRWVGLEAYWGALRWPAVFALITLMMGSIYHLLPNRDQRGSKPPVLIGALVGTSLWVLATVLFRFYVANFGSYSKTYGFVGGIIVLLLWLYLTALAILFGGEVAATVEQMGREEEG